MGIGNNWNHYIEENSEVVLESWLLIWLMSCFQLVIDVHSINVRIILLHDIKPWTFMLAWFSFLPLFKISRIWWVHTFEKSITTFGLSQHDVTISYLPTRKSLFLWLKFSTLFNFFPVLVLGFGFRISCRSFGFDKLLLSHRRNYR